MRYLHKLDLPSVSEAIWCRNLQLLPRPRLATSHIPFPVQKGRKYGDLRQLFLHEWGNLFCLNDLFLKLTMGSTSR